MDIMLWIWVAVIATALIVEAMTGDMTSIWFSVGGVVALIVHAFSLSLTWQITLFVIVSLLCIVFLRKITKRLIQKPTVATNIDKQIGMKTKLIDPITKDVLGSIKINGIIYSAITENEETIESGTKVEIIKVDGNKMIVKKVSNDEETVIKDEPQVESKLETQVDTEVKTEDETQVETETETKDEN